MVLLGVPRIRTIVFWLHWGLHSCGKVPFEQIHGLQQSCMSKLTTPIFPIQVAVIRQREDWNVHPWMHNCMEFSEVVRRLLDVCLFSNCTGSVPCGYSGIFGGGRRCKTLPANSSQLESSRWVTIGFRVQGKRVRISVVVTC